MRFEQTQFGFNYGAAEISRLASDEEKGWVVIRFKTAKASLQLYATKTGKIRIIDEKTNKEIKGGKQ